MLIAMMLMAFGCAHVRDVTPAGGEGEFYVVVDRVNPFPFVPINAPMGSVLLCKTITDPKPVRTSCVNVLRASEARMAAPTDGAIRPAYEASIVRPAK